MSKELVRGHYDSIQDCGCRNDANGYYPCKEHKKKWDALWKPIKKIRKLNECIKVDKGRHAKIRHRDDL